VGEALTKLSWSCKGTRENVLGGFLPKCPPETQTLSGLLPPTSQFLGVTVRCPPAETSTEVFKMTAVERGGTAPTTETTGSKPQPEGEPQSQCNFNVNKNYGLVADASLPADPLRGKSFAEGITGTQLEVVRALRSGASRTFLRKMDGLREMIYKLEPKLKAAKVTGVAARIPEEEG